MRFGRLRNDDSGHFYLVPDEEVKEFDKLYNRIINARMYDDAQYERIDEFNERYSGYRTEGGARNLQIVLPNTPSYEKSKTNKS